MTVEGLQVSAVIHGVLNVNKEAGWTSHDVVAKLRKVLRERRVGHAGTLDPAATGVLPILVGKATRIAEYLVPWQKEYRAVLRLGETTDTQDASGTVLVRRSPDGVTAARVRAVAAAFVGRQHQVPPMYSAVKVKGVPLYRMARSGRTVEREAREIVVHDLVVVALEGRDVTLRVVCSKGTYVRTLCADIGEALGVGGHVRVLERTRVGPLRIEEAMTVPQIGDAFEKGELLASLVSLDEALQELPEVVLDRVTAQRALHGVPVPLEGVQWTEEHRRPEALAGQTVRLKSRGGRLLALGSVPDSLQRTLPVVKVLVEPGQENGAW